MFSERSARQQARRFRSKGLDRASRRVFDLVFAGGVQDRTVLEIGGGIGAIQVELLRAGAATATSVELTPSYEDVAAELLSEAGLTGRVERRVGDFVASAADIEAADIVVMNRVVCCYPDMPTLVGLAAERTRRTLVMTFPVNSWPVRAAVSFLNLVLKVSRSEFKVFVRAASGIRAEAEARGLEARVDRAGLFWHTLALNRAGMEG